MHYKENGQHYKDFIVILNSIQEIVKMVAYVCSNSPVELRALNQFGCF